VLIINAEVRKLENGRQQLRLAVEVSTEGAFLGCNFFYAIMLDGSADFFLSRLLLAAFPGDELAMDEVDTEALIGKCMVRP